MLLPMIHLLTPHAWSYTQSNHHFLSLSWTSGNSNSCTDVWSHLGDPIGRKKPTKIIKDAKDSLIKNVYSEQNMPTNSIIKDITRFINQGTEFQMYIVKVFTEWGPSMTLITSLTWMLLFSESKATAYFVSLFLVTAAGFKLRICK